MAVRRGIGSEAIPTSLAHLRSNGRLERLHRTHQEESLLGTELEDYGGTLAVLEHRSRYYNQRRPHSALQYLCPQNYYRDDPAQLLEQRQLWLAEAKTARQAYWRQQEQPGADGESTT